MPPATPWMTPACVISKLSIDPTFDLLMHPITPVTAVNMRVSYQVGLMAKQAAPAPKHTTSHLLCTLFCLYTTHLFTLVFVFCTCCIKEWISIMAPAWKCENTDLKR